MRVAPALTVAAACLPLAAAFSSLPDESPPPPSPPAPLDIVLLHMNDHHSHLEEDDFSYAVMGLNGTSEVEVLYGGYSRLVTAFHSYADKYDNVIKVHAGDAITGTSYYSLYKGEADAAMMNHICFDAFEIGNHEFDDGDANLASFIQMLKTDDCDTTVLGANIVPGPDSPLNDAGIEAYTLFEFEGQTVGMIGINVKQKTEVSSQPDEGTVDELKKTVIGTFEVEHCFDRFPGQGRSTICHINATYGQGGAACNFVAKAFLMIEKSADLAIQNGGGCRTDIAAGPYSLEDAYTLLPFSNTLVVMEMKGSEVVAVLNDALTNTLDNGGSSGSYPYAAGLRYAVDASQPSGNRISDVEVNPRLEGMWTPIDLTATYHVVTNNYIASGRDGYLAYIPIWEAGKYVNTYREYAQGVIDYVTAVKTVPPFPEEEYSTTSYTNPDGCLHDLSMGPC